MSRANESPEARIQPYFSASHTACIPVVTHLIVEQPLKSWRILALKLRWSFNRLFIAITNYLHLHVAILNEGWRKKYLQSANGRSYFRRRLKILDVSLRHLSVLVSAW